MKLTRSERETIISKAEDEETWHVYTASAPIMRRVRRICRAAGVAPVEAPDGLSLEAEIPLTCLRLVSKRKVSDEERARLVERGRALGKGGKPCVES